MSRIFEVLLHLQFFIGHLLLLRSSSGTVRNPLLETDGVCCRLKTG